jgi:hypothetical protein
MSAEHHDNTALVSLRGGNCVDNAKEIARDEYVGQRLQECSKASVFAGRRRELSGRYFVGPPFDWNGADLREIGLRGCGGSRSL